MKYYKKVLMPIEVTIGNYCSRNDRVCSYFRSGVWDIQGRYYECSLGFYPLNKDKKGRVLKPKSCKKLKEVT